MKILIDENIPYAPELFSLTGEVVVIPGRLLSRGILKDADALIVRSTTRVTASLLTETQVKFLGTTTSGIDHVDTVALADMGIKFSSAPGCNATAVVEYIFSALLTLAERDNFKLCDRTVGIVGVGNIGSCLYKRLKFLGVKTILCDPLRANRGDKENFYSLDQLIAQVDILTCHVPLFTKGPYKSWHLADVSLLMGLKPYTIIINTCRGSVIDNAALLQVLSIRKDISVVLDVWEFEPNLCRDLLKKVDLATPHIAGHTLEGKARGTVQVFDSWCKFIGQSIHVTLENLLPIPQFNSITLHGEFDQIILKRLVHLVYDIRRDDAWLRKLSKKSDGFNYIRQRYYNRREWSSLQVICDDDDVALTLKTLGFCARSQHSSLS
ncbi:DUF3410 domain-containing protein [Candidatus Pantoea carbekii]|uniref:Erythronate-4-phosphate dehydrogenase n=1 Tax=Candidatus Pantoea carbekii TaxID=1235990 RepID=U3U6C8_9GAMM|nr:DUF3410 domain-containing protein [Candidatus Pantoea carbekii]AKC31984.1 erythronate-4-phosphate dehydrogenase PdxB [Candidatus Pantoea carbekii]BAO00505.1 PdxB protein [Candidatus Pantoea carbekii]